MHKHHARAQIFLSNFRSHVQSDQMEIVRPFAFILSVRVEYMYIRPFNSEISVPSKIPKYGEFSFVTFIWCIIASQIIVEFR